MTVDPNSLDLPAFMAEHLQRAEPDLLRSMLSTFVQALMSAEADAICGAPYGERSPERTNSRNGYRTRDWDWGVSRTLDSSSVNGQVVVPAGGQLKVPTPRVDQRRFVAVPPFVRASRMR